MRSCRFHLALLLTILSCGMLFESSVLEAGTESTRLRARISQTLGQPKYSSLVREDQQRSESLTTTGPLAALGRWAQQIRNDLAKGFDRLGDWLQKLFMRRIIDTAQRKPPQRTPPLSLPSLAALGALVIAAAVSLVLWQARPASRPFQSSAPINTAPVTPVADEQTLATALPEAEWLRLANDFLQAGERRLAVRALHLAGLAMLAQQGFLSITAFKTTADYRADLKRRAQGTAIPEIFARNSRRYESTWYGLHEASQELIQQFQSDLQALHELSYA